MLSCNSLWACHRDLPRDRVPEALAQLWEIRMANRFVVLGIKGEQKDRLYDGQKRDDAMTAFARAKASARYQRVSAGEGVLRGDKYQWTTIEVWEGDDYNPDAGRPSSASGRHVSRPDIHRPVWATGLRSPGCPGIARASSGSTRWV